MNLAALANTLEGDLGGRRKRRKPPPPSIFIPSRYPHTYAYDWLRSETEVGHNYGRGEMAGIVKSFCHNYGIDDHEALLRVLADRYLSLHHIEKT